MSLLESSSHLLLEYLLVIVLILVAEQVIAVGLSFGFKLLLGLRGRWWSWVFLIFFTPLVHHMSHLVPVVGHIVVAVALSWGLGMAYRKRTTGAAAGIVLGFVLLVFRLLVHYAVIVLGILVFAGKLFADLNSLF